MDRLDRRDTAAKLLHYVFDPLSDFRVGHTAFLDELLTRSVAALMHEGLVQALRHAYPTHNNQNHDNNQNHNHNKVTVHTLQEMKWYAG